VKQQNSFLVGRRVYLSGDGRVVFSKQEAVSLLFPEGTVIPMTEAVRLGLVADQNEVIRHNDPTPVHRDPVPDVTPIKRRGRPRKQA
jgi:hypothetical protein